MTDRRYMEKNFRTAILGGYQKAEVEEYIDSLTAKLEEACREKESREKELTEEREASKAAVDRQKAENAQLKKENEQLMQWATELKEKEERFEISIKSLKEQIDTYEKRSAAVADVLADARLNADEVLESANIQAKSIVKQAEENAQLVKTAGDDLIRKDAQKYVDQLKLLQVRMNIYLNALDKVQNGINEIYGNLSKAADSIPASIDTFRSMAEICMNEEDMEGSGGRLLD